MKTIVVTDQAAGTAGKKLVERPEPRAAANDVVVRILQTTLGPTATRSALMQRLEAHYAVWKVT
ncbi:hypothetical protein [Cupriavidus sp. YR651]|uniref:hypothetical protein n=1 Tax=Cupriavidus sp. YR651 TaxID=1855315 RepID=UPI000B83FBE0|nr:hypothetical protein [Cupriavidus sp. YR651]